MLAYPECAHAWSPEPVRAGGGPRVDKDACGNVREDGDTVTMTKNLKHKASSRVVKQGARVKRIRLVDEDHDNDCRIDGLGTIKLKSEFVQKQR
jgi:protein PhnA